LKQTICEVGRQYSLHSIELTIAGDFNQHDQL
jgi:hypothetical protein